MRKRDWACVQEELAASVGVVVSSWHGRRYDDRSHDRSDDATCLPECYPPQCHPPQCHPPEWYARGAESYAPVHCPHGGAGPFSRARAREEEAGGIEGDEEGMSKVRGQFESGRRQGRRQGRCAMYAAQLEMERRAMGEEEMREPREQMAAPSQRHTHCDQRLHQGRVLEGGRHEGRNEARCSGLLNDWERLLNDSYDSLEEVRE